MRRRQFITLLGGAAATSAGPVVARAQQADRMRRIGLLLSASQADAEQQTRVAALRDGLRTLGWIEGRNFRVEERWAVADSDLLKKYVQELLDLAPDLIVTGSTPGAQLLRLADRPIPVVFAGIADPVGSGVVPSLARPGGNITGFTAFEYAISGKWLALLKELSPQIEQVALIFNAGIGRYVENFWRSFEASALSIGIKPVRMAVRDATEIENAIAAFAKEPNGGLLSVPEVTVSLHRDLIIGLAARYRMPMIYPYRFFPRRGGLASYGIDVNDQWRRSATYVDRILKGEKPADLPVQAPIKFEFVINLKTAKTLGLTVPLTLLAQADEVIE